MNTLQKSNILRILKPNSMPKISFKSHHSISKEFLNYKPIQQLDNPIDEEGDEILITDCSYKKSESTVSLQFTEKLKIDQSYIRKTIGHSTTLLPNLKNLRVERDSMLNFHKRLQLFIDLDNTLIYTYSLKEGRKNNEDTMLDFLKFITKRPHLNNFLRKVSNCYDIIVYSSAMRPYVDDVLQIIDPYNKYISGVLSNSECVSHEGLVIKVMNGRSSLNSSSYLLVDDNVLNIHANPNNSILISPFYGDQNDTELCTLSKFLVAKSNTADIRKEIKDVFNIMDIM